MRPAARFTRRLLGTALAVTGCVTASPQRPTAERDDPARYYAVATCVRDAIGPSGFIVQSDAEQPPAPTPWTLLRADRAPAVEPGREFDRVWVSIGSGPGRDSAAVRASAESGHFTSDRGEYALGELPSPLARRAAERVNAACARMSSVVPGASAQ